MYISVSLVPRVLGAHEESWVSIKRVFLLYEESQAYRNKKAHTKKTERGKLHEQEADDGYCKQFLKTAAEEAWPHWRPCSELGIFSPTQRRYLCKKRHTEWQRGFPYVAKLVF